MFEIIFNANTVVKLILLVIVIVVVFIDRRGKKH